MLYKIKFSVFCIYHFNILKNVMYFCDGKAEFSAAITLVFGETFRNQIN